MIRFRPVLVRLLALAAIFHVTTLVNAQQRETDPTTVDDLRAIEEKVELVVKRAVPATVGIIARGTYGSGVIVSGDGYVLTAGHVSTEPGRRVRVVLADGRAVRARTLGWGQSQDLGLLKIDEEGEWPHLQMGRSDTLKAGDWCVAIGHPGGYEAGRAPVVRTGRLLSTRWSQLRTDCAIASGDSGGPLLDLEGRVIGIHSRINPDITRNYHVPVSLFQDAWTRLTSAETWGRSLIGVRGVDDELGYRITAVIAGYPAERAGVQVGDIVTRIDDQEVSDFNTLARNITRRSAGSRVRLSLQRGDTQVTLEVEVTSRGEAE